jgi:hypothetical protein
MWVLVDVFLTDARDTSRTGLAGTVATISLPKPNWTFGGRGRNSK